MTKYIKLIIVSAACVCMTSCATVFEAASYVLEGYSGYVESTGDDFLNLNNAAHAWQRGNVGKGLVLSELGVAIADEFTDKDLSNISNILKDTRNAFISDSSTGYNNTVDVASAVLYGGAVVYDFYEEKSWEENLAAFYELVEEASDPKSYNYDPYFEYRYEIDEENRCIRKRDFADVIADIRDLQIETYTPTYNSFSEEEMGEEIINTTSQELTQEVEENTEISALSSNLTNTDENIATSINQKVVDKYAFNVYTLSAEQKSSLNALAEILINAPSIRITIVGHTCYIGSDKANESVGLKRAAYAKRYLVECGVDEGRINIKTAGAKEPVVHANDANSLLANRRITFYVN